MPSKIQDKRIIVVIKFIVSVILLYYILRNTNIRGIVHLVLSANILLIIMGYISIYLGNFISIFRWRVLLRAQNVDIPLFYLFKSYLVGIFFNNLLPSTVGGDAVRAYDSWRMGASKGRAISIIFVDRFLGLFALMIFALASIFIFSKELASRLPFISYSLIFGCIAMASAIWIIFIPSNTIFSKIKIFRIPLFKKIHSFTEKITNSFLSFKGRGDVLIKGLGLSLVLQANVVFYYYLLARSLNLEVEFSNLLFIIPVTIFTMMIPITINGIGIRENIFALLLTSIGVLQSDAVALAWLAYGLTLTQGILGGIIYAFRGKTGGKTRAKTIYSQLS